MREGWADGRAWRVCRGGRGRRADEIRGMHDAHGAVKSVWMMQRIDMLCRRWRMWCGGEAVRGCACVCEVLRVQAHIQAVNGSIGM